MNFYRYVAEGIFFVFTALVFYGGFVAIRARYLMNAVLGLALSLFGVAGLFFHLDSPFLALMQILIGVGAVCVIIAFGIMVGPKQKHESERKAKAGRNAILAISACIAGSALLIPAIIGTTWKPAAVRTGNFSVQHLGENLLRQFCLPFELISVVLLAAIVGALIIAGIGREDTEL
jgi:NADH:ubiquinone oxidoreductase subunit 6 (subunit J)